MKKLNRQKIIQQLEISRQGFNSSILIALKHNDIIFATSLDAHHNMLNKMIVDLGGENVDKTPLDFYNEINKKET